MKTRLITKLKLKLAGVTLSALACTAVYGADIVFDFDTINPTNPASGFITVSGTTPSHVPFAWCSGLADVYGYPTNGNPATGGYLSIADGDRYGGGQNLVCVFPDIDSGYPIKAFHLTADVRAGNSGSARPADGFSISYCREGDPILVNATNGTAFGAAGGDDAATTLSPNGSGDLENGTKSGVAIIFDAWQGNMLPDTGPGGTPGPDVEGIAIRVDDKTLRQLDMSGDRNGNCYAPTNDTCTAAACADCGTEQTGGWAGDGGAADSPGSLALCWARLDVELTTNKLVTVIWKGCTLVDHFALTNYPNHRGRLVLMGRTGGSGQNAHFDNIHLVTVPAIEATLDSLRFGPNLNQFRAVITDNGASVVTNVPLVKLDGVNVTSSCTVSKVGQKTTVTYTQVPNFVSGSTHSVDLTWQTTLGQTLGVTALTFTVTPYIVLPPSLAVPSASVDTSVPGLLVKSYQTVQGNPNNNWWTEQQLQGQHGANIADYSAIFNPVTADGIWWTNNNGNEAAIDFDNGSSAGQFSTPNYSFNYMGINVGTFGTTTSSNTDNASLAVSGYMHFPVAGLYEIGVNSDDGFRVTFSNNPKDKIGVSLLGVLSFSGGRGIANNQNIGAVYVGTPGYYGVRLLWENGGGGAGVEFYTTQTPATNFPILINDNNTPGAVFTYPLSSAAPAYVSFADPPMEDDQVFPVMDLHYQITDDATTVSPGNVTLTVNGTVRSPTVTKTGNITDVALAHPPSRWPIGTNTVNLSYRDSAGNTYDHNYYFIVQRYVTLDTNVWTASGSGANPGFGMFSFQTPNTNIVAGWQNTTAFAIAGGENLYSGNVAGVAGNVSGVINFSQNAAGTLTANGDFQTPGFPDTTAPGLPGIAGVMDNDAFVAKTFVEFPAAGFYLMGVNSDDGFLVIQGDRAGSGKSVLSILAPQSLADSAVLAIDQSQNFGARPPYPAIVAQAVLCDPPWPTALPNNAAALAGKIAILHRDPSGGVNNHSHWAEVAGAIAVVFVDQDNAQPRQPGLFGAGSFPLGIPCVMIDYSKGTNLIAHATTNSSSPVVLSLGYASPTIGEFSGGRGSSDTIFGLFAPAPGLYPITLYWENGGGDANCEWFTMDTTTFAKILINDPTSPVKAWMQRAVPTDAHLSVSGTTLSWTGEGELEFAYSVTGPWFKAPNQSNPQTIGTGPAPVSETFYRIRSY